MGGRFPPESVAALVRNTQFYVVFATTDSGVNYQGKVKQTAESRVDGILSLYRDYGFKTDQFLVTTYLAAIKDPLGQILVSAKTRNGLGFGELGG